MWPAWRGLELGQTEAVHNFLDGGGILQKRYDPHGCAAALRPGLREVFSSENTGAREERSSETGEQGRLKKMPESKPDLTDPGLP